METPSWLDTQAYPFASRYVDVPDGRMHYVDEGTGDPIVMIHGTPTWSFLYRHLIRGLSDRYRVIAPDQLGFGLSDRPADYSYRPQAQARNIAAFLDTLDIPAMTLVVHDFGGPVGLSYALDHPDRVQRLILFNTWLWSLENDIRKVLASRFLGSPLGRLLCMRFNFEVNVIVPYAYADRAKYTPAIRDHYRQPARDTLTRHAIWIYARELLQAKDWYDDLWSRRETLQDIPALLLWGMKDPLFDQAYLDRWRALFQQAQVVQYPDTGHFVQEEQTTALVPPIHDFMTNK